MPKTKSIAQTQWLYFIAISLFVIGYAFLAGFHA
jgi:hypothetical protein